MTSYDLIWHLIELLLKNKETKLNDKSQEEGENIRYTFDIRYVNDKYVVSDFTLENN